MSAADTHATEPLERGLVKSPPPAQDRPASGRGARRRPATRQNRTLPYLLITPALVVMAGVLGWPLIDTVVLSFQDMRRNNLWGGTTPPWVGLDQYTTILGDSEFWHVFIRTVVFVVVCVFFTMLLGLLIAMLLQRVSPWLRVMITSAMVAVWAMPLLVSTSVFKFMFDSDYGLVNELLSKLPGVDYAGHNWFLNPTSGLAIIAALVVWAAIPFIAISLHSALTQVPKELEEAARIDGASGFGIFRFVTFPVIKPVFVMTTTLSIIWDFGVLGQVLLMRNNHPEPDYQLLGLYSFTQAFTSNSFSTGAAISIITVVMLSGVSVYYLRQLMKIGEVE
ncbi:sugar ABC transporter permease [Streptomyces sp. So13.3]|uniref:carbohydrate ABC transporter permease n=1 Tax=Streptomyces TaxID=1883 RepID=UPI001105C47C|nr:MULTISPECIES: sugar ABC transporter permease [Streptomyces]MCZ4095887.1 sugar ABC transporter permease [Streptomyces sp. H39-C1]QNA75224.1 sugar ABC transporter permease [Streptomyces sp. So13.3]